MPVLKSELTIDKKIFRFNFSKENNISDGHIFKLLFSNQIKQTLNLGEIWKDTTKIRNGTYIGFTLFLSQFKKDLFRKYIKSFFDEKYETDYLRNKFKIPSNLMED